jgi:hypothetical protein
MEEKHEGPNRDGGENRAPRSYRLEAAHQMAALELDADLLASLSNRGLEKIMIQRVLPATGEGDVSRPRITEPLGSANQQNGVGRGRQNKGDRGPPKNRIEI